MFILRRNLQQGVTIDVNGVKVHVTLVECHSGVARIGFDAPPEVKIWRDELIVPLQKPTSLLPENADTRRKL